MLNKNLFALALLAGLGHLLPAVAAQPLRVAADPVPHAQILAYVQKLDPQLALQIIEIPNGVNSNELLAHGDVDANYFQHLPYLKSQEQALGQPFAVAASVHIEPLGIYSQRHKSSDQVPQGGTVAVPNNVTNLSRALYLLQSYQLIRLKPGFSDPARDQATPKDIADNPRQLKILEIESPQIPRALEDVDLAVINGNYALEAGLVPVKDALGLEQAEHNPYANILVTTPQLQDDPRIRQLAKDLRSPEVAKYITESYKGSVIPAADRQP
ncbi:MetQ/NlpA family ABC transporter substrate-binding protein [Pseudomonas protegens]|uniref:MetQ/NlpA family ABC transporter substrate-binding protein n=1 Tax=Pseudomonas protegens TaxID=380021 RepID=UPI00274B1AD4|nr:MetQ/NlpA family ABC transporter substrate-binding protein [Pseudomonas protegens]MDP9510015.1 MetQ/NlpA family ABC transporter substrate-binding protein [Pseudomonas protegens]